MTHLRPRPFFGGSVSNRLRVPKYTKNMTLANSGSSEVWPYFYSTFFCFYSVVIYQELYVCKRLLDANISYRNV